jgi:hypothetical protein
MCAALGGCVPAPGTGDDVAGDDAPDASTGPTVQQAYGGTYAMEGVWDLSQPFGPDGLGGMVADLLIEEIIGLASVPSTLEDEARDAIAGAIRQPIVDHVNGVIPPALAGSSPELMALDRIFSAVEIDGTLALTPGSDPDGFTGTDTISAIAVRDEDVLITISMAELLADTGAITVAGSINGGATGADRLSIGQHPLELRFGTLVAIVARDALGIDAFALADQAMTAIDCADVVDLITDGGTSYDITVGGQGFSVPAASMVTACDALRAELTERALGMVRPDAGIRLGGPARLLDGGDGTTDTVASEPGYGGAITALGLPVEPQVVATFSASR